MVTARKEVTHHVPDKKNFVGFMYPKTKKFIIANEGNKFVVSEDGKEAIGILEHATDTLKVQVVMFYD